MTTKIIEVFDGRLPEYQVVEIVGVETKLLKAFDSYEAAEKYQSSLNERYETPCGEEGP